MPLGNRSERHLAAQRNGVDPGARFRDTGSRVLVYIVVDVVEHETDVVDRVPVDAEGVARRAAAEDAARDCLRRTGSVMVVEVHIGIAYRDLPRAPATRADGMLRSNTAIGAGGGNVFPRLARHDVAGLTIIPVEVQLRRRRGRLLPRLIDEDAVGLTLEEEAA